jgi:hypothetical protein
MKGMELLALLRVGCLLGVEKRGSDWVGRKPWIPPGVFPQLQILKGFKSCVLKLRIPKGLLSRFSEVRILWMLAVQDKGREKEKENAPSGSAGKRVARDPSGLPS